jgi:uncharacterized protein YqjF (DUF2071 family)
MSALFIHYEIESAALQPVVPFELDVRDGKAYVSLVAFTQEKLRFEFDGWLTAWIGALAANHPFLNLRTYVKAGRESGIYFIAEWVPRRLAAWIAPRMFGLPYRVGRLDYRHDHELFGEVRGDGGRFAYRGVHGGKFVICPPGSLDEYLLERYVAFTQWRGRRRCFRVAHEPWPQTRADVATGDDSLLRENFSWWPATRLVGANFSPGVEEVKIRRAKEIEK